MTPTTEAALLVVVNNMDGEKWYTSTKHLEQTMKLSNISRTPEYLEPLRDPSCHRHGRSRSQGYVTAQLWHSDGDYL